MEDVKVTATGYDFRPARAAMQRYRQSGSGLRVGALRHRNTSGGGGTPNVSRTLWNRRE
jgi:hypothetical protein